MAPGDAVVQEQSKQYMNISARRNHTTQKIEINKKSGILLSLSFVKDLGRASKRHINI